MCVGNEYVALGIEYSNSPLVKLIPIASFYAAPNPLVQLAASDQVELNAGVHRNEVSCVELYSPSNTKRDTMLCSVSSDRSVLTGCHTFKAGA